MSPEGSIERSSSEETKDFLHQCDLVVNLLQLTLDCHNLETPKLEQSSPEDLQLQTECRKLSADIETLKQKVITAGGLASGGIFEWVDSPLVEAIREGQWVLVEGASLCAASVLDRLNPLLEPDGVLLLAERGVINGAVPSVKPHPNFRIFLTIDHTCGEVSRLVGLFELGHLNFYLINFFANFMRFLVTIAHDGFF